MINVKWLMAAVLLSTPLSDVIAKSPDGVWQRTLVSSKSSIESRSLAPSFAYNAQSADSRILQANLQRAPDESSSQGADFYYPLPDGSYLPLKVFSSPIMPPKLAAKYPSIRSYRVYGANDSRISGRIGLSSKGMFGYLYTPDGIVVIQPESEFVKETNADRYRVYFKNALSPETTTVELAEPEVVADEDDAPLSLNKSLLSTNSASNSVGQQLRVYRLALSLTGEGTRLVGGTTQSGLEFLVETVNFLNTIYEREVGIRLVLIERNDELVFLNANTDPFKVQAFAHTENNEYLKSEQGIPTEAYDLGHVIDTGGGGIATLGQVCKERFKGSARTGLGPGTSAFEAGVALWKSRIIGVFAHEVGHQFDALHTQNSICNRTERSAWEPHSGSTIMGYAGVCAPSLQSNSDSMLHAGSRDEILAYVTTGSGSQCGTVETFNYVPPVIDAGEDQFIPVSTPFLLSASAQGVAPESVTYTWDQLDLGDPTNSNPGSWKDFGSGPLFRTFAPSEIPFRVFPDMSVVLSDQLNAFAEILPTTAREINFRVTGRSGRGWGEDDIKLNVVANAGPFQVTNPIGTAFNNNQSVQVEWQVANTNQAPINCANVDIDLSVDGGQNFNQSLLQQPPHDGAATVTLPAVAGEVVRLRVKCSDNVFFAVSPATDLNANTDSGLITALPRLPIVSINGTVILEGTSGTTDLFIDIERANTKDQLVMDYQVAIADDLDGIASIDDFADGFQPEGTLVLAVGQKSTTFTIPIKADFIDEPQLERFFVSFSNFSSGNCQLCNFTFSIRDDDEPGDGPPDDPEEPDDPQAPTDDELCFPVVSKNNATSLICL